LPGLAVAPGRRALRHREDVPDGLARHLLRQERAHGVALVQELFEHADAIIGRIVCLRRLCVHDQRPLVGILLNGTSLSTRMSPGRPSTRSALMLRRISSVPPSTRVPGARSSIAWNFPAASASSGPLKTPAAPCRSSAYIATSWIIEPATSLPMEFSGPGRSPLDSAEM